MSKKYLALFKYEFKKLAWLYGAMVLFFIMYIAGESSGTALEAKNLLTASVSKYISFKILDPDFYFIFMALVAIMVYMQFNDGFNKLWHSLPFKNIDVIGVKLIVGVTTLLLFFVIALVIKLAIYFDYAEIYKLNLSAINIDPSIISPLFIIKAVAIVFTVYVAVYFFAVLCQYIVGNCISGIVFAGLFINLPTLLMGAFDFSASTIPNKFFTICPYFYDPTVDLSYSLIPDYIFNLSNLQLDDNIFFRFNSFAIAYYGIIAIITLYILLKISTTPKWIEQSSPFNKKWVSVIFKLAFVICFSSVGATITYNSTVEKVILAIVFALIGFLTSTIIVKRQGVRKWKN